MWNFVRTSAPSLGFCEVTTVTFDPHIPISSSSFRLKLHSSNCQFSAQHVYRSSINLIKHLWLIDLIFALNDSTWDGGIRGSDLVMERVRGRQADGLCSCEGHRWPSSGKWAFINRADIFPLLRSNLSVHQTEDTAQTLYRYLSFQSRRASDDQIRML